MRERRAEGWDGGTEKGEEKRKERRKEVVRGSKKGIGKGRSVSFPNHFFVKSPPNLLLLPSPSLLK